MAHKIDTEAARADLPARREQYWSRVRTNRHVGVRITKQGEQFWFAKMQQGRNVTPYPLGKLDAFEPKKARYKEALRAANEWFDACEAQAEASGAATVLPAKITMRSACSEYLRSFAATDPAKEQRIARRFEALVYPYTDRQGKAWIDRPLSQITGAMYEDWTQWLKILPSRARGADDGALRKATTNNRDIKQLRAALNYAAALHKIAKPWQGVLSTDTKAEQAGARGDEADMSREDRAALIEHASAALKPLLKVMATHPIRPGALAAALVEDYKPATHSLYIRKDKAGAKRTVGLAGDKATRALFAQLIAKKTPKTHLFTNSEGAPWNSDSWNAAVKAAAALAKLPKETTIYWLRHSRITDLLNDRSDDALTPIEIAKFAGTSLAMIEAHYQHLRQERSQAAMARVPGF